MGEPKTYEQSCPRTSRIRDAFGAAAQSAHDGPDVRAAVEELAGLVPPITQLPRNFEATDAGKRVREIGIELNAEGGYPRMYAAARMLDEHARKRLSQSLNYVWAGIGDWQP